MIILKLKVINLYKNLACLGVCLFVSNKRQNGWTDRTPILCGASRDPREGLWMIKILEFCVKTFFIFVNFWKRPKNPQTFFILYKEKMLTDKASIKSWNRSALKSKILLIINKTWFLWLTVKKLYEKCVIPSMKG